MTARRVTSPPDSSRHRVEWSAEICPSYDVRRWRCGRRVVEFMSEKRVCFDAGYIGPPRIPIPADSRIYMKSEEPIVGCNQIWCPDCESWVRHRDGAWLAWWPSR